MSETQTEVAAEFNPFDPANHSQGGGLWDGKTVTITSATPKVEALFYGKDKGGAAVIDKKTGNQSILTALFLTGIAEGGDDKERKEEYSVGNLVGVQDGAFVMKEGGPLKFHANSNFGKLSAALKAAGFDIGTLLVRDAGGALVFIAPGVPKQDYSKLVGARFVFKAESKVGKDGKSLKDAKGYDKSAHFPVKFLGYSGGAQVKPAAGAVAAPVVGANGLEEKAVGAVLEVIAANGGKIARAALVQALAVKFKGQPESNPILGLVVNDAWHKGKAWGYNGVEATL